MTVGELIAALSIYDSELMVVVDGYEGGVDKLQKVKTAKIAIGTGKPGGIFGVHRLFDTDDWDYENTVKDKTLTTVVYLPRP